MNAFPYAWRISKYDPALRNAEGHYLPEDWTFFAQIGQVFNGRQLSYQDYFAVESAYVRAAMLFLSEAHLASLQIAELQGSYSSPAANSPLQDIGLQPATLQLGGTYDQFQLEDVIRLSLREAIGCKLEEPDAFYLHFGWDYYLYVGSMSPSLKAIQNTSQNGLYVEAMVSPYL